MALISAIRIDSRWLPSIVVDDPLAPGPPNPVAQFLKPKITIVPKSRLLDPVVSAPYGEPGETQWPLVRLGLVVMGAAALAAILIKITR